MFSFSVEHARKALWLSVLGRAAEGTHPPCTIPTSISPSEDVTGCTNQSLSLLSGSPSGLYWGGGRDAGGRGGSVSPQRRPVVWQHLTWPVDPGVGSPSGRAASLARARRCPGRAGPPRAPPLLCERGRALRAQVLPGQAPFSPRSAPGVGDGEGGADPARASPRAPAPARPCAPRARTRGAGPGSEVGVGSRFVRERVVASQRARLGRDRRSRAQGTWRARWLRRAARARAESRASSAASTTRAISPTAQRTCAPRTKESAPRAQKNRRPTLFGRKWVVGCGALWSVGARGVAAPGIGRGPTIALVRGPRPSVEERISRPARSISTST